MSVFIPEITTTVKVNTSSTKLDAAIELLESDEVMSFCFTDVIDRLKNTQTVLDKTSDEMAFAVSESLQSHQEQIISMKHKFTGMMANSVDITKDGDAQYLVGNTAVSVEGFPYPLAIETGRREVYPVNAKMLRWWTGPYFSGEIVFAKKSAAVDADPFVQPSIDLTMGSVEDIVNEFMSNLLG